MSKFFCYNQNNSGGSFDFNAESGISHFVVIEADNADEANKKAEAIGLYFDGSGDCPCCGERWSEASESDGEGSPKIYGESAATFTPSIKWMQGNPEAFIHYADGRIVPSEK